MGERLPPSSIHNHEHLSTTTLHFEHINLLQSLHTQYPILKMSENIQITLISNDGVAIKVDKAVAEKSMLIKNMMEDLGEGALNTESPFPMSTSPSSRRLSNGASTTSLTPSPPPTMTPTPARRPQTLRSGTRSSCRLTRRCSSRSSLPPTTSISSPSLTLAARPSQTDQGQVTRGDPQDLQHHQ